MIVTDTCQSKQTKINHFYLIINNDWPSGLNPLSDSIVRSEFNGADQQKWESYIHSRPVVRLSLTVDRGFKG